MKMCRRWGLALGLVALLAGPAFAQSQEELQRLSEAWKRGVQLLQAKEYQAATEHFLELAEKVPKRQIAERATWKGACVYNAACAQSLLGNKQEAALLFARSVKDGYRNLDHLLKDSDLDNIRKEGPYRDVVALLQMGTEKSLDSIDTDALRRKHYGGAAPPVRPATPQAPDLGALRKQLVEQLDAELKAMRERMVRAIDKALKAQAGRTPTAPIHPMPPRTTGKPWIGFMAKALDEATRKFFELPEGEGLAITKVTAGGPAAKAGLKAGDVLVMFAGDKVGTKAALRKALARWLPGDRIRLTVIRDGSRKSLNLTLGSKPGSGTTPPEVTPPATGGKPWLGFRAAPVSNELRQFLDLPAGQGLELTSVVKDGPAAKAGIQAHDILLTFNGKPVGTTAALRGAMEGVRAGQSVAVTLLREGREVKLTFTLGSKPGDQGSRTPPVVPPAQPKPPTTDGRGLPAGERGFLGVRLDTQGGGDKPGLAITQVVPDSPAAKAGLAEGDRIRRFADREINSVEDLRAALATLKVGDAVTVVVDRAGAAKTLTLTIGLRPGR